MKVILVHNPFNWRKPKTILSWIIRRMTYRSDLPIQWNHCAAIQVIEGIECVGDFQSHSKLRPFAEWLEEDKERIYKIVEKESTMPRQWVKEQVMFASGRFLGYDWIKLVNHFTMRKKIFGNKAILPESENREVCSEFIWFLLTGEKVNWCVPNDLA
jgi:hypothetical protein